ncbi:DegT/DnrJ/EryC1/StrS family aminotransferase [Amycolatopsis sp. GM8]|uniref:DegT/DnrJ/EryC1/StrS family aminotransferase n=1 Tax=Amycolatopsis sp. GM8 TaxID=2896530 RepID=UPI001F3E33EB|nr:DegT/DnrJ/EryC1/StrS family aminotransferase [Amycolatopsis sp. GM8]
MNIPLNAPYIGRTEFKYVEECLSSTYVSSAGPFVGRFESAFAKSVGSSFAVACSSGTAALHVALRLAGAQPGATIAVSDFTFIASANAAAYTGADLLLVDSEPQTWNMNTQLLLEEVHRRARLGKKIPQIVEIVHVLGHPADMAPLLELREKYGVRIVEDAAEALGSRWISGPLAGRQVGTVGDFGCYSFNGNKVITSGGGGMIVTGDEGLADHARHLTTQAKIDQREYLHDEIGYNYRLTNLAAALGLAQLERLPVMLEEKRRIAASYSELLRGLDISLAPDVAWAQSSYWLYSVLLSAGAASPASVVADLAAAGIEARRVWPPLHQQRPYASTERVGADVADRLYGLGLSLPSSVGRATSEQRHVAHALSMILQNPDKIAMETARSIRS